MVLEQKNQKNNRVDATYFRSAGDRPRDPLRDRDRRAERDRDRFGERDRRRGDRERDRVRLKKKFTRTNSGCM